MLVRREGKKKIEDKGLRDGGEEVKKDKSVLDERRRTGKK